MNEPSSSSSAPQPTEALDETSARFAQLILQQTNMALMLLGKIAHPETGQVYKDVDAARLFIDQLEMLEVKTRGNLNKDESGLLKQSLMNLRLAFVEAVESPETSDPAAQSKPAADAKASSAGQQEPGTADDEHRKKFSKKY